MSAERYAGRHAGDVDAAMEAFGEAVFAVMAHRPGAGPALERALELDPALAAAHALRGFAAVLLARRDLEDAVHAAQSDAEASLGAYGGGTTADRALVRALDAARKRGLMAAAGILDAHLAEEPRDLLAIKLSHALRFMSGDVHGMLATTAGVLDAWAPSVPGYGFVLGCHAFGLEEAGDLAAAEAFGRRALEHEPADAWAVHAVAHVHEMRGQPESGLAWLEATRPVWSACNNFRRHVAWHQALCQIGRGRPDRALALYDEAILDAESGDYRDFANAASLLWRLAEERVDTGQRWARLADLARAAGPHSTLAFARLHHLLALIATGDVAAARGGIDDMARRAATAQDPQAAVGRLLGEALLAVRLPQAQPHDAAELAWILPRIGGSRAQRDVFVQALAGAAAARGDRATVVRILDIRRRFKANDRVEARLSA